MDLSGAQTRLKLQHHPPVSSDGGVTKTRRVFVGLTYAVAGMLVAAFFTFLSSSYDSRLELLISTITPVLAAGIAGATVGPRLFTQQYALLPRQAAQRGMVIGLIALLLSLIISVVADFIAQNPSDPLKWAAGGLVFGLINSWWVVAIAGGMAGVVLNEIASSRRTMAVLSVSLIVSAAILCSVAIRRDPARHIAWDCEWLGLAPIPNSATELRFHARSSLFWEDDYIQFRAPARDIDLFLAHSPGIEGISAEHFTPAHQYLPFPSNPEFDERTKYFNPNREAPRWFNPTISARGRLYEIPRGAACSVIVDDATHTVMIRMLTS